MAAKRLLVSLDEKIFSKVESLAKYSHKSLSSMAKELIASSLETQDDILLSKLADERLESDQQWINHDDAWK